MAFSHPPSIRSRDKAAIADLLEQTPDLWQGHNHKHRTPRPDQHSETAGLIGDLFAELPEHAGSDKKGPDLSIGQSTGFLELDTVLPWSGWPQAGLVEIISARKGIGELQLLLPLLRQRSQLSQSVLWITPPYKLNGAALAGSGMNLRNSFVIPAHTQCNQALWSIEKALLSKECGLVMAWQNWLSARVLRRLQMAANEGGTLGVLFSQRPTANSPACLQLQLSAIARYPDGKRYLDVQVLKARGSHRRPTVRIALPC